MQLWQPAIPDRYTRMSEDQLAEAIRARKAELGSDLVILGHHYQQDGVIEFADFTGDSFKLSQLAAEQVSKVGAKYVVFCGVHFMAETADILTDDGVAVILPDLGAGCSMADMADYDQTVEAWEAIHETLGQPVPKLDETTGKVRVIPVCYMNSSAAIKAFCGAHGGAVCTSSNCDKIFDWALAGGETPLGEGESVKILFLPDQHLGRNTGAAAGFDPATQMCVWDPRDADGLGGCTEDQLRDSTFILWKGHCSVHKLFRPEHIDQLRAEWPDVTVIAHPECAYEVCQKADLTGSTEGIIQAIENAEPGSRWAIATEVHLVNRLCNAAAERGVTARILSECQCLCTTMYRIDLPHLLWILDHLAEGKVLNQISVHPEAQRQAMLSLNRMLKITAAKPIDAGAPEQDAPLID
ncbi:quinolinate synthase NadA [Algisphaera agarilytica]|nr:quinolinate synthase NadA [Algisphaera agarilytica]